MKFLKTNELDIKAAVQTYDHLKVTKAHGHFTWWTSWQSQLWQLLDFSSVFHPTEPHNGWNMIIFSKTSISDGVDGISDIYWSAQRWLMVTNVKPFIHHMEHSRTHFFYLWAWKKTKSVCRTYNRISRIHFPPKREILE